MCLIKVFAKPKYVYIYCDSQNCLDGRDNIVRSSFFLVNLDNAFHFPDKGVDDVVKISGMRSLGDFTVCLWMSSSNSQGSIFSYAVSDQANELLIFYNKYFELHIGGEKRYLT